MDCKALYSLRLKVAIGTGVSVKHEIFDQMLWISCPAELEVLQQCNINHLPDAFATDTASRNPGLEWVFMIED